MINSDEFRKQYNRLQAEYKGKFVIGSVDRLYPLSGVIEKFEGYQIFLSKYPQFREKTVLVQVKIFLSYIIL